MRNLYLAALSSLLIIGSSVAQASSHREAPFITKYPQVDGTDFYMFSSYEPGREDYVTMIANYLPIQAAYGGPNYFPLDPNALYEIHIDNDGDAREDISFQFDFRNASPSAGIPEFNIGGTQINSVLRNVGTITGTGPGNEDGLAQLESYRLSVTRGTSRNRFPRFARNAETGSREFRKPFDYSGTNTFGGEGEYTEYANQFINDINIPGCGFPARVFVGQRNEGFKISLGEVFDLINFVPIDGDVPIGDLGTFPGGVQQDPARNILAENNVTSLALEVHKDCLGEGSDIIGAWSTSSLRQVTLLNQRPTLERPERVFGRFTQVSRLGMPLVNELVIPFDRKDRFNNSVPSDDGQFADAVTNPVLPEIINSLFLEPVNATLGTELETLAPTNFPRTDLVATFLTGFDGVNAFPNGTPSEMLRLNTAIPTTPRADQNTLGLAAGDLAGFPNGRRPGDDVVDIALRVVMGALCHDLPLGENGAGVNLGLCSPEDAVIGTVPLTDGAPLSAAEFNNSFPYLLTPYPGSPVGSPLPVPTD